MSWRLGSNDPTAQGIAIAATCLIGETEGASVFCTQWTSGEHTQYKLHYKGI
jgi:hypothetical protein